MNNQSISDTIILAGSGRSGTTWIGNILAANPNMRIVFEPFDGRRVPEAAKLPLRPYARPHESYPEWEPFVRQCLLGQIENEWVNRQGRRRWATRRLVKEIRANLMLGWVTESFQPQIVFAMRHPCAVVLSRVQLDWDTHLDVFLEQPELVADYLEPFLPVIEGAETAVQKHAIMWCVENLIPLQQLPRYGWQFCTYETLYAHPETEAKRLLSQLGIRNTWLTQRAIKKLSMVTRADSALVNQKDPLRQWQRKLSAQDIQAVLDIVQAFGIELYDDDPMPHLDMMAGRPV